MKYVTRLNEFKRAYHREMTARCIKPPTPAFIVYHTYCVETIPGGFVAFDDKGYSWAADTLTFREYFEMNGILQGGIHMP